MKRIAVVGIVLDDTSISEQVNSVLHDYSSIIVGRMGIPYKERGVAVISLIVDGEADEISGMTGKLGNINGVSVKSAISKK